MSKGSSTAAQTNQGIARNYSEGYQGAGGSLASTEVPFLTNELADPQGFGQPALTQMQTQGGQATAGALGAGKEAALLNASRTGNTAAIPGVIDQTTRNAMQQQSNNVLSTDIANQEAKLQQQQEASSGLEKMYGTDVSAALQSLGLSNSAIQDWTGANNGTTSKELGFLSAANSGAQTGNAIA